MSALVLFVRMHDGRYHGEGDWPPSPARLFQALVAGAGLGGPLAQRDRAALEWLEQLAPPVLAAPCARRAPREVKQFVPNNDSDIIGGDPARMSKIRTASKIWRPHLFDAGVPFVYAWALPQEENEEEEARAVCELADQLYQLGRGVDMAWAWGEILADRERDEVLTNHPGKVFFPSSGSGGIALLSPCPGSLESVLRRHEAFGKRFSYLAPGRSRVRVVFRRPPAPRFQTVSYDSPSSRRIYELREPTAAAPFSPWPLERAVELVVRVRDAAVARLVGALRNRVADVERVLVGRKPDGTNDGPLADRIRVLPLPSIGHVHADRGIRRILVEVPPTCPLRAADVHWAFSGLEVTRPNAAANGFVLTPAVDLTFARHFGLGAKPGFRTWRSVTAVALPAAATRRSMKLEGGRRKTMTGSARLREQARAARAVRQALRHAGIRTPSMRVRVQREPFEANGERAESFAHGTRFAPQRLRHVEVTFAQPIEGMLAIGDGRFLGLGILAPVSIPPGILAWTIESGLADQPCALEIAAALRRAMMARVGEMLKTSDLPAFFTGHGPDGRPSAGERSSHVASICDLPRKRLLVLAPHVLDRRSAEPSEADHLRLLEEALAEVRAGRSGRLRVAPLLLDEDSDDLCRPSRTWESLTPYQVTRHHRKGDASKAVEADVRDECRRRKLPAPSSVEVRRVTSRRRTGLSALLEISFRVAVPGPLVLGRSRYKGGGLFQAAGTQPE